MKKQFTQAINEIRADEIEDKPLGKACCDILRALLLLRGTAWHTDLINKLRYIWTKRDWKEEDVSKFLKHVNKAVKVLQDRQLLLVQKRKRARPSGAGIMEENFYSLRHQSLTRKSFADDRELLKLEISEMLPP